MLSNKLPGTYLLVAAVLAGAPVTAEEHESDIERGRYLVSIGGCNDCHTSGFAPSGGETPESEWLLGDSIGYRGPWGTTYAPNLRTYAAELTEEQWVSVAKALRTRPPMPWWALNEMTTEDLRAVYRYIRGLETVDSDVPEFVPPGQQPSTPYIQWPGPPE